MKQEDCDWVSREELKERLELQLITDVLEAESHGEVLRATKRRDICQLIMQAESAEDFAATMAGLATGLTVMLLLNAKPEGYDNILRAFMKEIRKVLVQGISR